VHANGVRSRAVETQEEVKAFAADADKSIRRMQRDLRKGSFVFQPAKGKKIPKKAKGDFRPIIVAPVETRIVQRAVLDRLLALRQLRPFVDTPYSFGGIQKREDDEHAAVPAAIKAVLDAKASGLNYVRCADIASFFTRIRKSSVRRIVADAVPDADFLGLFDSCIKVELSNLEALREDAQRFPRADIGVAQGSALSPLLGNLLLHSFDNEMNEGDCRCLRYIDDIIILAPTEKAANARYRKAENLLKDYGMTFSPGKSLGGVKTFETGFDFLGIELNNGLIRPDGDAVGRFKQKVQSIIESSQRSMVSSQSSLPAEHSLISTLLRLSGTIVGWAKHYRFCNDRQTFEALDAYVDEALREYLGAYAQARKARLSESRRLLGVGTMKEIDWKPFIWPT
jgi:RNA-directed DNA polymerase